MTSSGDVLAQQTQLQDLDLETLKYIFEKLVVAVSSTKHPQRSILNARLVSRLLHDTTSQFVTKLAALRGSVPASLWQAFPGIESVRTRADGASDAEFAQNVLQTLSELPERLKSIAFEGDAEHAPIFDSLLLAHSLAASACRNTLQSVTIEHAISTAAADAILQGLPHLQDADLCVSLDPSQAWRPSADLSNMAGTLNLRGCGVRSQVLDLSGLRTASKLRHLMLKFDAITNLTAISSLACLEGLELRAPNRVFSWENPLQVPTAVAEALQDLQQLRRVITHPDVVWPADRWAVLASLPALTDIETGTITIDAAAPAAAVTRLCCSKLELEQPDELLPGCLARQLPHLQDLQGWQAAPAQQVAAALRGHTAVRHLQLQQGLGQAPAAGQQPVPIWQQQLSLLPELQSLDLRCGVVQPDSLLADVAGCSKLTSLSLASEAGVILTPSGLAALEAGPCSSSLEEVTLKGCFFEVGVQLVAGQLAALRKLEVQPSLCCCRLLELFPDPALLTRLVDYTAPGGPARVVREVLAPAAAAAGWRVQSTEVGHVVLVRD